MGRLVIMAVIVMSMRMFSAVMMMLMLGRVRVMVRSVVVIRLVTVDQDVDFGCRNAAAVDPADMQFSSYVQSRDRLPQKILVDTGVQQRAKQHVAADTGKTVKICDTHTRSEPFAVANA
jgi:hypothetical protein